MVIPLAVPARHGRYFHALLPTIPVLQRNMGERSKGNEMPESRRQFSLHRLEGLTDGIYAIAMTLLVLSLPLPQMGGATTESDIVNHLGDYSDLFTSYAITFLLLGNFWIIQLKIFKYIKASCVSHLWVNLGGLLFVCLIPFSSSLMGYNNHTFTANLFFHLNIFLVSVFFLLQCRVLLANPDTIADSFDKSAINRVIRINLVLPVISLFAMGLSFISPEWSIILYIAVPFLTTKIKRITPAATKENSDDI